MKEIKCSCCDRRFYRGVEIKSIRYIDIQTPFKKRWVIGKKHEKIYICEKCKNTAFAIIRNNLAIKTSDILDE